MRNKPKLDQTLILDKKFLCHSLGAGVSKKDLLLYIYTIRICITIYVTIYICITIDILCTKDILYAT